MAIKADSRLIAEEPRLQKLQDADSIVKLFADGMAFATEDGSEIYVLDGERYWNADDELSSPCGQAYWCQGMPVRMNADTLEILETLPLREEDGGATYEEIADKVNNGELIPVVPD